MSKAYVCTLSEDLQERARVELNEDPETRMAKVEQLRSMFKTRPDIIFRQDDFFLLQFLRNKKFDVQKAFKKIVHYYEVRRDCTDIFGTFLPLDYKYIFDAEMEMVCPGRDAEGRKVIIARNSRWDVDRYDVADGFRGSLMMMETIIQEEESQINGVVLIADYEGFTMKHFTKTKPSLMKKMTDIYENALPIRIKAIHFVNQPEIFTKVYAIMKSFISEKLTSRLHFHGEEYGSLHKYVPSAMLPADLGGQLPEFQNKEWREKLLASNPVFERNNRFGFPQATRSVGETGVASELNYGMTGSFKRLDI